MSGHERRPGRAAQGIGSDSLGEPFDVAQLWRDEERNGERMATAEKAVFDTLYLARARGKRFSHLTEVDLPAGFRDEVLSDWATKIQDPRVRSFVQARIADLVEQVRR